MSDKKQLLKEAFKQAPVGKKVADSLYIHSSAWRTLPELLRTKMVLALEEAVFSFVDLQDELEEYTVIKFSLKGNVSFLYYPDFDTDPHPGLFASITISPDLATGGNNKLLIRHRKPEKRWILHRKELMVAETYEHYNKFKTLSDAEEKAGLLDKPPGQRNKWEEFLTSKGHWLKGHTLYKTVEPITSTGIIFDEWDDAPEREPED
jgi:DNA phosphorothioation-associated putative methyltransferase